MLELCFHCCHHLVFSWLLILHIIYGGRANLQASACHSPRYVAYPQYGLRFVPPMGTLKPGCGGAEQAMRALPVHDDGLLYLMADSTLKMVVEVLFKALKEAVRLAQHPVTKNVSRVAGSVTTAIRAYLS